MVSRSNREHEKCYVADGLEVIGIIPEHLADRFSGKQAIRSRPDRAPKQLFICMDLVAIQLSSVRSHQSPV